MSLSDVTADIDSRYVSLGKHTAIEPQVQVLHRPYTFAWEDL